MSRTYNHISKTYGYKYYGTTTSERTGCRKECSKAIRKAQYLTSEGLSEKELLNEEMRLYKSTKYKMATAAEKQEMIAAIDMKAAIEYSFTTPTRKVKGTICW